MAIGSMVEAILLSTALGHRIRVLSLEKQDLQQKERRLIELSITDELTGLYNKRWFSSRFQSEVPAQPPDVPPSAAHDHRRGSFQRL